MRGIAFEVFYEWVYRSPQKMKPRALELVENSRPPRNKGVNATLNSPLAKVVCAGCTCRVSYTRTILLEPFANGNYPLSSATKSA